MSEPLDKSYESSESDTATADGETYYCSFCAKTQQEVDHLIAGPTVFICDECVELCMRIVLEKRSNARPSLPLTVKANNRDSLRREIEREIERDLDIWIERLQTLKRSTRYDHD